MKDAVLGRIIGVDTGEKRVGLAISDSLQVTSRPAGAVDAGIAADRIAALAASEEAAEIVVGLPLNMDGSEGESARKAREFASLLEARTSLPVALWDERLTSVQAERLMISADMSRGKRKKKIDGLAAQLMLQSYLDSKAFRRAPGNSTDI